MAFTLSLKLPVTPSPPRRLKQIICTNPSSLYLKPPFVANFYKLKISSSETRHQVFVTKAVQDGGGSEATEEEGELSTEANVGGEQGDSGGQLGVEIKRAMMERKAKEAEDGGGLWDGVAEEIGEIEWPAFGKVLGTTGVVLGVIAGSSVVLLTVNAILAELSDRVFAGRGVQDFFG